MHIVKKHSSFFNINIDQKLTNLLLKSSDDKKASYGKVDELLKSSDDEVDKLLKDWDDKVDELLKSSNDEVDKLLKSSDDEGRMYNYKDFMHGAGER